MTAGFDKGSFNGYSAVVASGGGLPVGDSWHLVGDGGEPSFQNSWENFNAVSHIPLRFKKTFDNFLRIEGLIKSGTTGAIFQLPVGYRPQKIFWQAGGGKEGSNWYVMNYVVVTTGLVYAWGDGTVNPNDEVSFNILVGLD